MASVHVVWVLLAYSVVVSLNLAVEEVAFDLVEVDHPDLPSLVVVVVGRLLGRFNQSRLRIYLNHHRKPHKSQPNSLDTTQCFSPL